MCASHRATRIHWLLPWLWHLVIIGTIYTVLITFGPPLQALDARVPTETVMGSHYVARDGTSLHIVQGVVIAVLSVLIITVKRISRDHFLDWWLVLWLALLASYVARVINGLQDGPVLQAGHTPIVSLVRIGFDRALSLVSTFAVICLTLSVQRAVPPLTSVTSARSRSRFVSAVPQVLALLGILLVVLTTIGFLLRKPLHTSLEVADASVGCVFLSYAGYLLGNVATRQRHLPQQYKWWIVVAFTAYGGVQLTSAWLDQSHWAPLIYVGALLLKVSCTLAMVLVAVAGVRRRLDVQSQLMQQERRRSRGERERQKLREMAKLRVRAANERIASRIRRITSMRAVLQSVLEELATIMEADHAVLYTVWRDSGERQLVLSASIGPLGTAAAVITSERGDLADDTAAVRTALNECNWDSADGERIELVPFGSGVVDHRGLFAFQAPSGRSETQRQVATSAAKVVAVSAFADLERVQLEHIHTVQRDLRALIAAYTTVTEQLTAIAKHVGEIGASQRVELDVTDQRSGVRYVATYPQTRNVTQSATSPYPESDRLMWIAGAERNTPTALLQVVVRGISPHVRGVVRCQRLRRASDTNMPYGPADVDVVRVVADTIGFAIERAERERSLELFLARSAHELRNPIGHLRNTIHLLLKTFHASADPKLINRLRDAVTDVNTLRRLVDLVDAYRGARKEKPVKLQLFGQIVWKAVQDGRAKLTAEGMPRSLITFETLHHENIPRVVVPRFQLNQVVGNLVENAIKYRQTTAEGFRCRIIGGQDGDYYTVDFCDWGIGVPPGWEIRIFSDGIRAPNAVRQSATGMGMGLAIAREIMTSLGGDLVLTSSQQPTTFQLRLPKRLAR